MNKTLALLLAAALGAGTAQANDLLTVYREAVAYDAQFAAARASLAAGKEKEAQGLSGLLPTIGLSANTTWNDVDFHRRAVPVPPTPQDTSMQYNSNGWGVQLSQPIFRWQNFMQYRQGALATAQVITRAADDGWRTVNLFETMAEPLANAPVVDKFTF